MKRLEKNVHKISRSLQFKNTKYFHNHVSSQFTITVQNSSYRQKKNKKMKSVHEMARNFRI